MFVAYFDESGQLEAGGYVCLAGFVASEDKWVGFNAAWNAALVKHGVPYLHTTDLANFKKVYRGWTHDQQKALMTDLMDAIHAAGRIAAIGAVMSVDDFNSFPKYDRGRMRDPFFPLFQEVVRGAARTAALFSSSALNRACRLQTAGGIASELAGLSRRLSALSSKMEWPK